MRAMILAAGRGSRMRPLTDHTHKGLLKVADVPLLERHVKSLVAIGVRDIVINVSYLAEQIQNYLGNGQQYGASIHYSIETTPLEVGGGIIKALPLLGCDPFIVINCDVLTDYPIQNLKLKENVMGHIILVKNPDHNPKGDFCLVAEKVTLSDPTAETLTYAGIALYHPKLFQGFPDHCSQPMLPILLKAIECSELSGEFYQGFWSDIGTPERLSAVHSQFETHSKR